MGPLDQSREVTSSPRLSDVPRRKPHRSFASLAALPSNVEAIEAALLFGAGMEPFGALVGPSGWGKSHLLEAAAHRLSQEPGISAEVQTTTEFLQNASRADSPMPLVLDDSQEALSKPRQRLILRLALERRVRTGRPTLLAFTLPKVTRQLTSFLPGGREWRVATLVEPSVDERVLLLNQLSSAEGLSLSPGLVKIIARQMHGNGRTLAGAMKRLRLDAPTWLDRKSTLRACGLLDPFFSDNSAWDLKHRILRVAEGSRAQFSMVPPLDLALFTMLRVACLSEAEVARAAGVSPAEAYQRANRFAKLADGCEATRGYVSQFVESVVSTLADE